MDAVRPPERNAMAAFGDGEGAGYTSGMKTAISIPDDLFSEADRLAKALGKSRSQLYADAIREFVARRTSDRITDTLNAVCKSLPARSGDVDFVKAAARRALRRSEW